MAATVRRPIGADDRWKPGDKKRRADQEAARTAAWNALPEEEKQRRRAEWAQHEADMLQWRKDVDEFGDDRARELFAERIAQRRAQEKIKDREARIAVEGDTDTNHDNIEAAE